jgi:hypothetical protein
VIASATRSRQATRRRWAGAALALVLASSVAALFATQGDPVLSSLPLVAAVLVAVFLRLPLAFPSAAVLFLVVVGNGAIQLPVAGGGSWDYPLWRVGSLLLENMDTRFGLPGVKLSLLDVFLVLILVLAPVLRASSGERSVAGETLRTPRVLFLVQLGALAGVLCAEAWGLARGGDFRSSLWQIRTLLYIPLLSMGLQLALRRPADHALLGYALLAAAATKASLAVWAHLTVFAPTGSAPDFITSHDDSVLFVAALALLLALWLERRTPTTALLAVALGGLVLFAMKVNHRRMAWVELAAALALVYVTAPRTPRRRSLTRTFLALAPIALLYVAVGWGSSASVFTPVQTIRSVLDPSVDASNESRQRENYNLVFTLRQNPLVGSGFGHEYIELVPADDLSRFFELWRFVPHNSMLGIWAFSGLVGFSLIWMQLVAALYFAFRRLRVSTGARERVAAVVSATTVISFALQSYGDMAFQSPQLVLMLGAAVAVAGQLAPSASAISPGSPGSRAAAPP